MPYDPRMLQQIGRMGLGMMAPEPFQQPQQQPRRTPEWWEQPLPTPPRKDQSADQDKDPSQDPDRPKQPQPSLMQMLMLGGRPTYSGSPRPGASGSYGAIPASPWGWLGNVGSSDRR
jgi:hypothetical protein